MVIEYKDNPPDILIRETIDRCEEEELTYEEAKGRVSLTMVERYMVAELNVRMEQYEKNRQGDTPSELEEFLKRPLDKELLAIVEKRYKSNYGVGYNMNLFLNHRISRYVGKVGLPPKQSYKSYESEPIITKELYEEAVAKMEKYKEQSSNENQNNNPTMVLE